MPIKQNLYNFLKSKTFKGILAVALGLLFSASALKIRMNYLDGLFLDLRQFVTNSPINDKDLVILDIVGLTDQDGKITLPKMSKLFEQINAASPKKIILGQGTFNLMGDAAEQEQFVVKSEKYPEIFWYFRWGEYSDFDPSKREHKNVFLFKQCVDTKLGPGDSRIRRIFLGEDCSTYDPDLQKTAQVLNIPLPPLASLSGVSRIYNSCQFYFKQYDRKSLTKMVWNNSFDMSLLRGKIVFVESSSNYNVKFTSQHIFSRFDKDLLATSLVSDSEILANIYENFKKDDFIRTPDENVQFLWVFAAFVTLLFILFFSSTPMNYLLYSVLQIFIFIGIDFLLFSILKINLDLSHLVSGFLTIQYVGLPLTFLRYTREIDRKNFEQEKILEREKFRSRFVVKAARADLSMKVAAKVSHDIRGPLMGLQVGSKYIKGKISAEAESLINDSIARLKYIADDVLKIYRNKSVETNLEPLGLKYTIDELLESYRHLYVKVEFEIDVDEKLEVTIPKYLLQRCLSNLLNNSVEALAGKAHGKIQIRAENTDEKIILSVSDNGPGISPELRSKLFHAGATFKKAQGTGLGLFQARQDLELYGAYVQLAETTEGATFRITFPQILEGIPFDVSADVLVLENEALITQTLKNALPDLHIVHCRSVDEAWIVFIQEPQKKWTVMSELVLSSENETGFDFLDRIQNKFPWKSVLCTSFADHEEVIQLAAKYKTLLIQKSLLHQLRFQIRK